MINHPKHLHKCFQDLCKFILLNKNNLHTVKNIKIFESILYESRPINNIQKNIYIIIQSISNSKIKSNTDSTFYIIPNHDEQIINILKNTKNECLILWCKPRIICRWFNISGYIYIKWDNINQFYRIIPTNPKLVYKKSSNQYQKKKINKIIILVFLMKIYLLLEKLIIK